MIASGSENTSESNAKPTPVITDKDEEVDKKPSKPETKRKEIVYGDKFPEVLSVKAAHKKGGKWSISVTLSSAYDTRERYADAWRVLDKEGKELGIRILGHHHANEQPFTRSGTIHIPESTKVIFVEGRDKVNGWSGQRFEMKVIDL